MADLAPLAPVLAKVVQRGAAAPALVQSDGLAALRCLLVAAPSMPEAAAALTSGKLLSKLLSDPASFLYSPQLLEVCRRRVLTAL